MNASRLDVATLLLAADQPGGNGAPGWWEVTSGLLLALAGVYATWAQFVYPKLAERKAKRQAASAPAAEPPPQAPTVDPVVLMIREQQELVDDLRAELAAAHRRELRQAGTIARLTAELAACRSSVTP